MIYFSPLSTTMSQNSCKSGHSLPAQSAKLVTQVLACVLVELLVAGHVGRAVVAVVAVVLRSEGERGQSKSRQGIHRHMCV